ncbi:MAG: S1C family serine protease [Suilimivivens sp.]
MEENHNQETDFMKETIKQRPLNRRKLIRRTLVTAAMAVIFGTVACLTFLLLEPVISNKLYPEEEPSTVVLVEETQEDEILPEDMIVDESQMNTEPAEPPALEDEQIAQVLSEMKLGVEDYNSLYNALAGVAKEVQKSMVTVVGITSDVDWFNNVYESEGAVSGVIIADNGKELLILTNYNAIKDAEILKIRFYGSKEYEAALKKRDLNTGLAILSVLKTDMEKTTLEAVKTANLGSSAGSNLAGNPVIAIGQPMGVTDSLCYGFITSAGSTIDLPDSKYKWITTDIYGSTNATGVLVNLKGQIIGIIDTVHNNSDTKNLIGALGITDLKKVIERMSNDKDIPYLGIHGADVLLEIHEELEVPYGAYIMEIDMDSPAMAAGIQSGDVITGMGEAKISTYQELISCIIESEPEQIIPVTLLRQGPDGYTEMELDVVLAMR